MEFTAIPRSSSAGFRMIRPAFSRLSSIAREILSPASIFVSFSSIISVASLSGVSVMLSWNTE